MDICDTTRNRTYIATSKFDVKSRQKLFEMTYMNVSVFTNDLSRIIQQPIYFTLYNELANFHRLLEEPEDED